MSDRKAAYAAWRERLKSGVESNQLIDLRKQAEEDRLSDEWSMDHLFAPTTDEDDDLVDEVPSS